MEAAVDFLYTYWFYISLSVCVAISLYFWGIQPFLRSTVVAAVGDLPGPTPLPFIGHSFDLFRHGGQFHLQFDEYYKKYGRLFTMFVFSKKPSIVVNDPELMKEIYVKEFHKFHDRPRFFKLPSPFDSMMTSAKGETWHRLRTTLSPTFSAHKIKLMIPLINKSCDLLDEKLGEVAKTGETIDIHKYHQALVMEAILSSFFGIASNAQKDDNDPAFKAARESVSTSPLRRVLISLLILLPFGSHLLQYFPSLLIGQFENLIHLTENIIATRRRAGVGRSKDLLDIMISKINDPSVPENKKLSDPELIAQSMIFLIAGYDTTSNTLSLICHNLATSPDIQEKLQREIDEVWSDEDQPPSYDTVQSLPYLDMVISETLRLYPSAFLVIRECVEDCVVKGLSIKKGTSVSTSIYSMHHDPEFYPDPEKFDPERFSAEAKQSRDPYTYLPFGHGPRNCVGMRFAQMEMKLALVRVLKKFSLVVAPETEIPLKISLKSIIGAKNGVKLRVKRREPELAQH